MEPTSPAPAEPPPTLALYHYDACGYCAEVRSALDALGVDAELRDVLAPDRVHRQELRDATGATTVPVLRIEEADGTTRWLPESQDIVAWLYERFGEGRRPPVLVPLLLRSAGLAMWGLFGLAIALPELRDVLLGTALGLGALRSFVTAARSRRWIHGIIGVVFLLGLGSIFAARSGGPALPWWYGAYALVGALVVVALMARLVRGFRRG
ncbi:MAG: glutathione S-transferase N-terminal domain-containing protein [Myxococcota bacterium]